MSGICEFCQGEDREPCCAFSGICCADKDISMCIHCGAQMQKDEAGFWRHHSQMELPLSERWTIHEVQD